MEDCLIGGIMCYHEPPQYRYAEILVLFSASKVAAGKNGTNSAALPFTLQSLAPLINRSRTPKAKRARRNFSVDAKMKQVTPSVPSPLFPPRVNFAVTASETPNSESGLSILRLNF